jgi:hypothetical protein
MHRPGYVQGGQEAKCGYLLLGIYYRRIPGDISDIVFFQHQDGMRLKVRRHFLQCTLQTASFLPYEFISP